MEWDPEARSAKENYFFLTSAVAPRPIAWVTTVDPGTGVVNAAPFSWFQAVCADPPMVMLSLADRAGGEPKDTLRNIQASGEFVVNAATAGTVQEMVASSGDYPPGTSEAEALGLATVAGRVVAPPRLAASPVHLECRLESMQRLGRKQGVHLVLGRVVHVHADDAVLDGRGNVDAAKAGLVARLGGNEYLTVQDTYTVKRPRQEDLLRREDAPDAQGAEDRPDGT